jgi:DNA-binding XRE family transcriptional regulator
MSFDRQFFIRFISDEFYKFRGNTDKSWSDFADFLDVSQQTMAAWKNGYLKRVPSQENINKLVLHFGPIVYEILGIERPPEDRIDDLLAVLPDELHSSIKEARAEYISEFVKRGISKDSPEARQIVIEAFEKRGIKVNVTE